MSTGFARDYVMKGAIAATARGQDPRACGCDVIADHGAFNATAQPTQLPGRLLPCVHRLLRPARPRTATSRGVYTNKAPGGVAYACSFRIAEAVYLVERLVDCLARELGVDPARAAAREPDRGPTSSRTSARPAGCTTPATTRRRCARRSRSPATTSCAREQAQRRERGELMGIGVSFFTEAVGAGPRRHMDILGPGDERRRGAARASDRQGAARDQRPDPGPGTRDDVRADRRRGARDPARGRRRRSTATPTRRRTGSAPTGRARRRSAARRPRWPRARSATGRGSSPRRCSRSRPRTSSGSSAAAGSSGATRNRARRSRRSRWRRAGSVELPAGVESGLDAETVYDPPNLTFPFGAYVCVVDIDPGTAKVQGPAVRRRRRLRRADQPDDRRGSDPRRPDRRRRDGADGADRVRRGGQLPRRLADGLPDPDRASRCPTGRPTSRSRRHRTTRSAPRESASRRRSARRRRSSTRSATRSRRTASVTSTCRARRRGCGTRCTRKGGATAMIKDELAQRAQQLHRRPRAVRARDRRAGPSAHERPRRRQRDRARRRDDRRVRRRDLRARPRSDCIRCGRSRPGEAVLLQTGAGRRRFDRRGS